MTGWYPYKWVCTACEAVHYYAAPACGRCGHDDLAIKVNSEKSVERLPQEKRLVVPEETKPPEQSPAVVPVPETKKVERKPQKTVKPPVTVVDTSDDVDEGLEESMRAFMEGL